MNRKDFLIQTTKLGLGSLLIPSTLLSACRKDNFFEGLNFSGKVIIIGAGAAGLYAGYILKSKGIDFQILEAASNYGGRLGQINGFADYPLDSGAQWLHGRNSLVGDLIAKTSTKITLDDSGEKFWFNNQLVDVLPKNTDIFSSGKLPDVSFKDYAISKGFDDQYKYIVENRAGDQGAAAKNLSVYFNHLEEENWSSGEDDFKFQKTYFDLINQNIVNVIRDKINLNCIVSQIDYSQNKIKVTDSNNNIYDADKVIITIPITILKENLIEFIPTLPIEKTNSFSKIGMDPGMKVFLKFNNKFFDQNIIGGSICAAYADEQIGKSGNDHILLAFIMGDQASYLTSLGSDSQIINKLLEELDLMYNGEATASFIDAHIVDWTSNPFIKGAYSYSTIGIGNAREIASAPINNKLFFAGEAMNTNGHHQTVHGAVETGYREVRNILKGVSK